MVNPSLRMRKLRLSNHKLAIETGRYSRPFKKPAERICSICKIEMEDEYHFLNICPAYQENRCSLLDYLELDALRALTRASYRSTKSYFTSSRTRIEHNKHK